MPSSQSGSWPQVMTKAGAVPASEAARSGEARQSMRDAVDQLEAAPPAAVDPAVLEENIAFLRWAKSDHFVFLGARDYAYPRNADVQLSPRYIELKSQIWGIVQNEVMRSLQARADQ